LDGEVCNWDWLPNPVCKLLDVYLEAQVERRPVIDDPKLTFGVAQFNEQSWWVGGQRGCLRRKTFLHR
jgi:hypothetical protein